MWKNVVTASRHGGSSKPVTLPARSSTSTLSTSTGERHELKRPGVAHAGVVGKARDPSTANRLLDRRDGRCHEARICDVDEQRNQIARSGVPKRFGVLFFSDSCGDAETGVGELQGEAGSYRDELARLAERADEVACPGQLA